MFRILTMLVLSFWSGLIYSQEAMRATTSYQDTLMVQANDEGGLYLQWQTGVTTQLQTITTTTGTSNDLLVSLNPILHFRDIEPGDKILIPFDTKTLEVSSASGRYPVYYQVKQGETIFGIARRMLNIPVEDLLRINALQDYNLRLAQVLLLGYLRTDHTIRNDTDVAFGQSWLYRPDYVIDTQMINEAPGKHFTTQKGVAWWNKSKPDPNLFALHRKAPINSLIEIRNPMFRRSVWAKVIGTIPATYADDISVIVSQGVARSLGAIDGRFYVEVSYEVK